MGLSLALAYVPAYTDRIDLWTLGAAMFTRGNLNPGAREDRGNRWASAQSLTLARSDARAR